MNNIKRNITKSTIRLAALSLLAGTSMLTSCSKNDFAAGNNFPEDSRVRISTSLAPSGSSVLTRADGNEPGTTTYTGTTLGLYVDYGYETLNPTPTFLEDAYNRFNVKYTQSGGTWTQDITAPDYENKTVPALWKNTNTATTKVYAYGPYLENTNSDGSIGGNDAEKKRWISFPIPPDQTGGIEAADLVWGSKANFNPYNDLNEKQAVSIELQHRLTKFTVAVTLGNQFDDMMTEDGERIEVASMTMHNTILSTQLAMADGKVSIGGNYSDLKMHPTTVTDVVEGTPTVTRPAFEAICVLEMPNVGNKWFTLTLNNDKKYTYAISTEVRDILVAANWADKVSGYSFRLNLRVGKDKLEIADGGVSVVDWNNAGGEITGGEAEEYIPIDIAVSTDTRLTAEALTAAITGKNGSLSIGGPMTDADFVVLRDWALGNLGYDALALKNLDLRGMTERTELPGYAFYKYEFEDDEGGGFETESPVTSLVSVKLPASVTTIGEKAFDRCTALTTIDLANITTIGNCAFADCTSLSSIDLANITTISSRAFADCTSLSSIKAPKLTALTEFAFYNCGTVSGIDLPAVLEGGMNSSSYTTVSSGGVINLPRCTSLGYEMFSEMSASGATLKLTAAGAITVNSAAFSNAFSSGTPDLVLNADKKADAAGDATPKVEADGLTWAGVKWVSISYVDNAGNPVQ